MELDATTQRVLGALVEKALTTPDGYPLSLNALRTACNQKTARDPVMVLDEADVTAGLAQLREHGLVLTRYAHGSRVPKYAHLLDEKLDFSVPQQAVVGVLLLRGEQTVGEVRTRTARMHDFSSLEDVEVVLASLADHKFGSWVEPVPRAPGHKEQRHRHLLGPIAVAPEPVDPAMFDELQAQLARLQQENARLRDELARARRDLDELTAP